MASTFLALSPVTSFFESLFTILFSDPMRPLPLVRTTSVGSDGFLMVPEGGLLGLSGFTAADWFEIVIVLLGLSGFAAADWFELVLVGLGGGGLLGGGIFEEFWRVSMFCDSTGGSVFFRMILLRTCATGVKLLILFGRGGLGFGVLLATGSVSLAGLTAPLEYVRWDGSVCCSGEEFEVISSFSVLVRGDIFFVGGGGRGMLGGGGMIRPVGLLTFFILALTLGGGMGVAVGVSTRTFPPSSLTLGFPDGSSALAAESSNRTGGTGGGGRCWGFARLCTVVVRRFGSAPALLDLGVSGLAVAG